jgi:hypothetical protein
MISINVFVIIIPEAVEEYFGEKERVVESRAVFLESFPYGADAINSR